jgi:hypothetical protein
VFPTFTIPIDDIAGTASAAALVSGAFVAAAAAPLALLASASMAL